MTGRLAGKVALVTGASSGIGEATAKALSAHGAGVVLAARRVDELHRVAKEITSAGGDAVVVRTDVMVEDDLADAVHTAETELGGLDIAFNNAGSMAHPAPVADQDPATWIGDMAGVLTSTFLSMRYEIPALIRRGGGVIVNNASQLGMVGIGAGISAYVAGKHGVIGLTRAGALEYANAGIRVNALALASVDTQMYRSSVGADEGMAAYLRSMHPIGRIATPEEAAAAVVFLAGDDAAFFTGSVLVMDGGWTAR